MKKSIFSLFVVIIFTFVSCSKKKETTQNSTIVKEDTIKETNVFSSKGYKLMKTNCFVCHMEKPEPSKREQMIAPPMLRVQEHYKPNYPNKDEFVTAIKAWVKNPTEDKVMMPGAVRKFNLMPKLALPDADLNLIAETLYDIDFGNMPKMNQKEPAKLILNDGKKWKLNDNSKKIIASINKQLKTFKSDNLTDYRQLGKAVFSNAKKIILDKSYDEKTFQQIQNFFHNIEDDMHNLIAAKTIEIAKNEQKILIKKFKKLNSFFE
jgi:hypothetical protein